MSHAVHPGGHFVYLTPALFTPLFLLGGFATSSLLYVILKFYRRSIHPYFFMVFFCFCQIFVLSQFLLSFFGATTKPLDCSFNMTLRSTAVSMLSYSMFCITAARFTALKLPLRYKRILHVQNQLGACLVIILWASSLSVPPLFGLCGFAYNSREQRCEYLDISAYGCTAFYIIYCFFGILFPRLLTISLYVFIYKSVRKNQSLKRRYARVTSFLNGLQNVLSITTVLTFVLTSENRENGAVRTRNMAAPPVRPPVRSPGVSRRERTMFNGAIDFVEEMKRPRGYSIVDRHPSGRTMRRYTSFECRKRSTYQKLVEDLHNVPCAIVLVVTLTSLTVLPLLCNVIQVGQESDRHSWDWFLDIALLSLLISLTCSPYAYLLTVKNCYHTDACFLSSSCGCTAFYIIYCFFGILFPRLLTISLYVFIYKSVRKNQSLKRRYARVTSFLNGLQNVLSITTVLTFVLTSENRENGAVRTRNMAAPPVRPPVRSPGVSRRERTMFNGAIDFVEEMKRPRGYSIVDRHPSGRTMRRYTSFECRKRSTYQKLVEDLHNVPFAIVLVVTLTSLTVLPLLCNVIQKGGRRPTAIDKPDEEVLENLKNGFTKLRETPKFQEYVEAKKMRGN
eukprot:sb/3463058/